MFDIKKSARNIMGINVHAINMEQALEFALDKIERKEPCMTATPNAEMIMLAQKDKEFAKILNSCDMLIADGAGIIWAGEQLGYHFPERVAGADFVENLLKKAVEKQISVYFLGGAPKVAMKAVEKFKEKYGEFPLAGIHDGYFDEKEEIKIIEEIKNRNTEILLVGMGVPKQEKWIYNNKDRLGNIFSIGIGGVFDVMAGVVPRAPKWMQKNRLEWAYRLFKQPQRIHRVMAIPKFMIKIKNWKGSKKK